MTCRVATLSTFARILARLIVIGSMGMIAASCATPVTQIPSVSAQDMTREIRLQENDAMQVQRDLRARLADVSRPVMLANADICPKTRPDIGVILHAINDYPEELRAGAARELGAGKTPSVLHVVSGSPAEAAGVLPGDIILIDRAGIPANAKAIRAALDAGNVSLFIKRGGDTLALDAKPEQVCDSPVILSSSLNINALASGRTIMVTRGLMDFTQSDDELALVIGHELAHNMMGHISKVVTNFIISGFAKRYTRPFESEADYVGLYYMVRAGYNAQDAASFWRRLARFDPRSVNRARTHPTLPDRHLRIAATIAEIDAKIDAGEPLIPNVRDGRNPFTGATTSTAPQNGETN